jgi:hypothetical protein
MGESPVRRPRAERLFDEHRFAWPEQPGDPEREAALPWFWFTDVGEAKTYLRLWWLLQLLGTIGFINLLFFRHLAVGMVVVTGLVCTQVAFLRIWIPLCRRAHPPLGRRDWFSASWFNPKSRHCLLVAWGMVSEGADARVGSSR